MRLCRSCGKDVGEGALSCMHCNARLPDDAARPAEPGAPPDAAPTPQLERGVVLSLRYELLNRLGAGRTGEVWKAYDTQRDANVAIRILPPGIVRSELHFSALKRQLEHARRLNHGNICGVYSLEKEGPVRFLVMEYVTGQTLAELLAAQPEHRITVDKLAPIARDLASALNYAHTQQPEILHGDVRPENIVLTAEGKTKLMEPVVGRELKELASYLGGGEESSDLLYLSPEQYTGEALTRASEIYAMGATLYACLAGHPPFWQGAIGHQLMNDPAADIPNVPKYVNGAIRTALAKQPARRPRTALLLVTRLFSATQLEPVTRPKQQRQENKATVSWETEVLAGTAPPVTMREPEVPAVGPRPSSNLKVFVLLALLCAAGIAVKWLLGRPGQDRPETPTPPAARQVSESGDRGTPRPESPTGTSPLPTRRKAAPAVKKKPPQPSAARRREPAPVTAAPPAVPKSDWERLWQGNGASMPSPVSIPVTGTPWDDINGQQWEALSTRHHEIYFQPTVDKQKLALLFQHMDNIYEFLKGRSPTPCRTPIRAFLVPGESANSMCHRESNSMRIGDHGDFALNFTSFLHEETHLFNGAALGADDENWWSGEYSCLYFQERARHEKEGSDLKRRVLSERTFGPRCSFGQIEGRGKKSFGEALAAMLFLEEKYGAQKLTEFRAERLKTDKAVGSQAPSASVFAAVFEKDEDQLDQEWREFFGWPTSADMARADVVRDRLETRVSIAPPYAFAKRPELRNRLMVRHAVIEVCRQSGLACDWELSFADVQQLHMQWITPKFHKLTCREALARILDPFDLAYDIARESNLLVLRQKGRPPGTSARLKLLERVTLRPPYTCLGARNNGTNLSVQFAVSELLRQVGLNHDITASLSNVGRAAEGWCDPRISKLTCEDALYEVLRPRGLTYRLHRNTVVLRRGTLPRRRRRTQPTESDRFLLATQRNDRTTVEKLLAADADVNTMDRKGNTALHRTASRNLMSIAELLISSGAEVDVANNRQRTPLHAAALKGHSDMAALLLKSGAAADLRDNADITPLHMAVDRGYTAIIQLLLDHGVQAGAQMEDGRTSLHFAALRGRRQVSEMLLDKGAPVDTAANNGWTALHFAAHHGRKEVAELLLSRGATPDLMDLASRTPHTLAALKGHQQVVEIITKYTALPAPAPAPVPTP